MNYNDQILENKAFKFAKQLIYNLAIGIVIILAVCLIFVYAFHFRPYIVLSDSMYPIYKQYVTVVIVHPEKEYKVGDVPKFRMGSDTPVVHRIIAIKGDTYVCHGDAVRDDHVYTDDKTWQDIAELANNMSLEEIQNGAIPNCQFIKLDQIEGKVVTTIDNWGTYINFIAEHKILFITIILGLWCFTYVAQNEIEMRNAKRLVY